MAKDVGIANNYFLLPLSGKNNNTFTKYRMGWEGKEGKRGGREEKELGDLGGLQRCHSLLQGENACNQSSVRVEADNKSMLTAKGSEITLV